MVFIIKFQRLVANFGWWNTVLLVISRVLRAITASRARLVKYYFVEQPVRVPIDGRPVGMPRTGSFRLDWVELDCPIFARIERPQAVLASRFAQGARCLLATREDGEFAGFLWFVIGPYEEDEVRARFTPQPAGRVAWDFDVAIAPRFQMSRLFGYLWEIASKEMHAAGVLFSMSRISAFNSVSLASHRRLGARIVGHATFLCVGRLQVMVSSLKPNWHWSWRDDQRPEIVIDSAVQLVSGFAKKLAETPKNS